MQIFSVNEKPYKDFWLINIQSKAHVTPYFFSTSQKRSNNPLYSVLEEQCQNSQGRI